MGVESEGGAWIPPTLSEYKAFLEEEETGSVELQALSDLLMERLRRETLKFARSQLLVLLASGNPDLHLKITEESQLRLAEIEMAITRDRIEERHRSIPGYTEAQGSASATLDICQQEVHEWWTKQSAQGLPAEFGYLSAFTPEDRVEEVLNKKLYGSLEDLLSDKLRGSS